MHKIQSTYLYSSLAPEQVSISDPFPMSIKAKQAEKKPINKVAFKMLLLFVCFILQTSVTTFGQTVTKQLYLSDPGQALDRVDPVATADGTTTQTAALTPSTQYLFAFRGASKTDFWRYNVTSDSWSTMASTPGTVSKGGALATNGTYVYALRGGTTDFWKYDPATNAWSVLASAPSAVSSGAALIHLNG